MKESNKGRKFSQNLPQDIQLPLALIYTINSIKKCFCFWKDGQDTYVTIGNIHPAVILQVMEKLAFYCQTQHENRKRAEVLVTTHSLYYMAEHKLALNGSNDNNEPTKSIWSR